MPTKPERLYKALTRTLLWKPTEGRFTDQREKDIRDLMSLSPHGSGLDCDCEIESYSEKRLVFWQGFHCMDSNGYYDGWIHFRVFVSPSWDGIKIRLVGPFSERHGKYPDVADWICECYYFWLNTRVMRTENGYIPGRED